MVRRPAHHVRVQPGDRLSGGTLPAVRRGHVQQVKRERGEGRGRVRATRMLLWLGRGPRVLQSGETIDGGSSAVACLGSTKAAEIFL